MCVGGGGVPEAGALGLELGGADSDEDAEVEVDAGAQQRLHHMRRPGSDYIIIYVVYQKR